MVLPLEFHTGLTYHMHEWSSL